MNVFDAIKGTILNVPKEISTGIKSLTNRDSVSDGSLSEQNFDEIEGINFDAGGALLSKFQNNWSDIHQSSEENAKHAKGVDSGINDLFIYLERQNDAVNQFLLEISSLPELLTDLRTVTSKIENLEGQFAQVEAELVTLADVCEVQELQRNQKHHFYQLETYRQRRNVELEQDKVQMARDHAKKVQRYEYHLQRSLTERQQAFEETFRDEVQHYKKYGKTSPLFKQRVPPDVQPEMLENFVPEEDTTVLHNFLAQDSDLCLPDDPVPAEDSAGDSETDPPPPGEAKIVEALTKTTEPPTDTMEPPTKTTESPTKNTEPATTETPKQSNQVLGSTEKSNTDSVGNAETTETAIVNSMEIPANTLSSDSVVKPADNSGEQN